MSTRPAHAIPPKTPAVELPDAPGVAGATIKRCTVCKRMLPTGDYGCFTYRKRYLSSEDRWVRYPNPMCKRCEAERQAAVRADLAARNELRRKQTAWRSSRDNDPVRAQAEREYQREWKTIDRRKRGIAARVIGDRTTTGTRAQLHADARKRIPARPFAEIVAGMSTEEKHNAARKLGHKEPIDLARLHRIVGLRESISSKVTSDGLRVHYAHGGNDKTITRDMAGELCRAMDIAPHEIGL